MDTVDAFEKLFGLPDYHCRMGLAIRQFFANGGRRAVVVRVSSSREHNLIRLRAGDDELLLVVCTLLTELFEAIMERSKPYGTG